MKKNIKQILCALSSAVFVITSSTSALAKSTSGFSFDTPQLATGCKSDSRETIMSLLDQPEISPKGTLPAKVDFSAKFPTPGNQGSQGSCTAWAVGYALKSYQENVKNQLGTSPAQTKFSPAYIYNQLNGGKDEGISISNAMFLVSSQGVCTTTDMPYDQSDYKTQPNATQRVKAEKYKGLGYCTILGIDAIKEFLARKEGVVVQITVYPDFQLNASNPIFDNTNGAAGGQHAICLVGYDDSNQTFKYINSYGTGYGSGGFGYMTYSVFEKVSRKENSRPVGYVMKDDRYEPLLSGDFNGDGKDDLCQIVNTGYNQMSMMVQLSNGSSFGSWQTWISSSMFDTSSILGRTAVGDFNGDGKDDVAFMYYYPDHSTKIFVELSTGSSFYGYVWKKWDPNMFQADKVTDRFTAGDFNGDGKDDLAVMYDYGKGNPKIFVYLSTGGGFQDYTWKSWIENTYDPKKIAGRFTAGDVNGDGKDDLIAMYDYGNSKSKVISYISNGSSFKDYFWKEFTAFDANAVTNRFAAPDVNGDGKADMATMFYYSDHRTNIFVYNSTGSGFDGGKNWYSWPSGYYPADRVTRRFVSGDFNGDHKDDLATLYGYEDTRYGTDQIKTHVYISKGNESETNKVWGSRGLFSYL